MKIPATLRWKPAGQTLGQGNQGTVTIVKDEKDEFAGQYALKALASGKPRPAYERFVREIAATKAIDHPAIVRIVDHSAQDDSFQFYVMPYREGSSLKSLLNGAANPYFRQPLAALDLFQQIADGIRACEQAKLVHRDLSPANVLVHPDQSITIIDFGLCQVEDAETITLVDEGVGTQNYMAPECESGSEGIVSSCADLYSAGKILWAAITNNNAFSRESPAFTSKSLRAIFPDQPMTWHLQHIFDRTIRHKREDRFANADQALATTGLVRQLIYSGYPPLAYLQERCPICGWGRLESFEQSHMVFGNPNPAGIISVQCNYCGFCFAVNRNVGSNHLERQRNLS